MKLKTNSTRPFSDKTGIATVGFCLWCNKNFYNQLEISAHNGDGAEACPILEELLSQKDAKSRVMERKRRTARINEKS